MKLSVDLDLMKAYKAGFDSVVSGPNTTNCNFRLFATPAMTRAWEHGQRDAKAQGERKEG